MGQKTSQIGPALAAQGGGFTPFSLAEVTLDGSVLLPGVLNRVVLTGSDPMSLLMPPSPTHNMLVGIVVTDAALAGSNLLDGNGKQIQAQGSLAPTQQLISGGLSPARSAILLFDGDSDHWIFVATNGNIGGPK